jgi:hypothetical protein
VKTASRQVLKDRCRWIFARASDEHAVVDLAQQVFNGAGTGFGLQQFYWRLTAQGPGRVARPVSLLFSGSLRALRRA